LLRGRRTIHTFKPEPPPRDVVLRALDLARWAPNHRLTEPWRFYLLGPESAEAIARLNAELVEATRGAAAGQAKLARWRQMPGWLLVTQHLAEDALKRREDYAACACAVHALSLALWSEGVGVKWTTGAVTRDDRFYDLLSIDPNQERVVGLLWYGYPADSPSPPPRSPLPNVLHERP
jgi:nitroreductase